MRGLAGVIFFATLALAAAACSSGATSRPPSTKDAGRITDAAPSADRDEMEADAGTPPDPDATVTPDPDAMTTPDPDAETPPDPDATTSDATTSPDPDAAIDPPDTGMTARPVITFDVLVPENTPAMAQVNIAGNFQAWDPASATHVLTQLDARHYQIALSFDVGEMLEFKFTRGGWPTVEKGSSGEEIANRTYTVSQSASVPIRIASWADLPVPAANTLSGDVTTTSVPGFLGGRRVWIYLPPGYWSSTASYPVLYMLDGQNVFDAYTSFSGEWQVDEALESTIAAGDVDPLIVVAVDNSAARIDEYTPWVDAGRGDGGGAAMHLSAITDVLKPYVDLNYRTLTGPDFTGISGSSLGGLFTLYATYARSDVFGRNAALSPSIWWADREIIDFVQGSMKPPSHVWMDMGTAESSDAVMNLEDLRDVMTTQGFVLGVDLVANEYPGAGHNEAAWAARFPDVLRFLFPN